MLSRATMQDQSFGSHPQGGGYMRQHPGGPGPGDPRRPSRLMQMREDYQRRLTKEKEVREVREKEEKMVSLYQDQQRRNEQRAERLARAPQLEDYPKSRLRQPGYMQQQQQGNPGLGPAANKNSNNQHSSVRDFFRERHEMEAKGGNVPPINQHYHDKRGGGGTWQRGGGGGSGKPRVGSGGGEGKYNAGVDRANPLAPIQARHGGISSAPARPLPARNKPHLFKQTSSSPDLDSQGHVAAKKRTSAPPSAALRRASNPFSEASSRATTGREKISDFQKWQMEQNRAREDRLKKLNMRGRHTDRQSRDWAGDYEYEDEEVQEEGDEDGGSDDIDEGEREDLQRKERELLQRIAQEQAELERMRRQREREEELEREEAERLRKQQAAEKERRRRQQQEEDRRRRQEEAQARRDEEEQQRAARAREERQRYEAKLDLYGDDNDDRSAPNSHREENPFQTSSRRDHHFQQPNSHRGGGSTASGYDRTDGYAAQKYTPKPPSEPPTPRRNAGGRVAKPPQAQRRPSITSEQYDELPAVPGSSADFYAQVEDEEQGVKVRTAPCKVCGRNFAEDRLQKHQSACKNAHKKRKAFDPTKMRTEGTEMAKYVSKGAHKKEVTTKKKADWRRQHEEFISNIRYAKKMTQMEQQGVAPKDMPPPPPSMANPDLVACPHCGRSFNESAAERHIPRCQSLKTRPLPNTRRRR